MRPILSTNAKSLSRISRRLTSGNAHCLFALIDPTGAVPAAEYEVQAIVPRITILTVQALDLKLNDGVSAVAKVSHVMVGV